MSLRIVLIALLASVAFSASFVGTAPAVAHNQPVEAGFERHRTSEGIEIGIWYPAVGTTVRSPLGLYEHLVVPGAAAPSGRHPLVVISHGSGGDFAGHVDTAIALARAGFIVAALTHPGDNWRDSSRSTQIQDRPRALRGVVTFLTSAWSGSASIDPKRIGAFGFSAGGFTVLAAAGGRPDLSRLTAHCAAHPTFFDCALLGTLPTGPFPAWPNDELDPRIKAIVVVAPALGFTFERQGLAQVTVPVQLWRADADQILPAPFYADAVRAALPRKPQFYHAANAGHFDFLAPCANDASMPRICKSADGFNRRDFHRRFNKEIVRFFVANLGQR